MKYLIKIFVLGGIFSLLLTCNAYAIGKWNKGSITRTVWNEKYQHIAIGETTYTVMPDIPILSQYKKDGAVYKKGINVYQLHLGDTVLFKVQGTRIYEIERLR